MYLESACLNQTRCSVTMLAYGDTPRTFATESEAVMPDGHLEIRMLPHGGFVAVLTPTK